MKNKKNLMFIMAFFIGISGIVYSNSKDTKSPGAVVYEDNTEKTSYDTDVDNSSGSQGSDDSDNGTTSDNVVNSDSADESGKSLSQSGNICVYVCGCVSNPGVYTVSDESRIQTAVDMAGGMTKEAAMEYVNLAVKLSDGDKVYIPSKTEADKWENGDTDTMPKDAAGIDNEDAATDSSGKININTASKEELTTISGIGESRADAIISYREENGNFKKIEDIMNVSGIKDALFNKICDYITV